MHQLTNTLSSGISVFSYDQAYVGVHEPILSIHIYAGLELLRKMRFSLIIFRNDP